MPHTEAPLRILWCFEQPLQRLAETFLGVVELHLTTEEFRKRHSMKIDEHKRLKIGKAEPYAL